MSDTHHEPLAKLSLQKNRRHVWCTIWQFVRLRITGCVQWQIELQLFGKGGSVIVIPRTGDPHFRRSGMRVQFKSSNFGGWGMKHRVKIQKNSRYAAANTCRLKIGYKWTFCNIIIEEKQEHQVLVLAFLRRPFHLLQVQDAMTSASTILMKFRSCRANGLSSCITGCASPNSVVWVPNLGSELKIRRSRNGRFRAQHPKIRRPTEVQKLKSKNFGDPGRTQ